MIVVDLWLKGLDLCIRHAVMSRSACRRDLGEDSSWRQREDGGWPEGVAGLLEDTVHDSAAFVPD